MHNSIKQILMWLLIVIACPSSLIGLAQLNTALAQDAVVSTETSTAKKKWNASLSMGPNTTLAAIERETGFGLGMDVSYQWMSVLKSSLSLGVSETVAPQSKASADDALVVQELSLPQLPFDIKPSVSLIQTVPFSDVSQDASLILGNRLKLQASKKFIQRVSVKPYLTGTSHLFKYETAVGDFKGQRVNAPYSLGLGSGLGIQLGTFTLSTDWSVSRAWTYAGSTRFVYTNVVDASVALTDQISVSLGIKNNGPTTRNSGLNSNVTLLNLDSTVLYSLVSFSL